MSQSQSIQQSEQSQGKTGSNLLRYALWGNALFSGVSGLVALLGAEPLAELMGVGETAVFTILGVTLIGYSLALAWFASRPVIDRRFAWLAIILDVVWVVDSIAILLVGWPPLTTAGKWIVAIIADIVAVFAIVQYIGLRRLSR